MKTKEEIEILKADALSGDPIAENNLGCAYSSGDGVSKDEKLAFQWFEKSALHGSKVGAYNVGRYYHYGYGVQKDIKKAIEWYEKSAIQNYGIACNALGLLYETGFQSKGLDALPGRYAGYLPVNKEEAFYWYSKGSNSENAARYNLARCYELGIGTHQNLRLAWNYYSMCKNFGYNVEKAELKLDELSPKYTYLFDVRLSSLDFFKKNPFRLLGVWSNSSDKEVRANQSKINALLKVQANISFPTDHLLLSDVNDYIAYYSAKIANITKLKIEKKFPLGDKVADTNIEINQKKLDKWHNLSMSGNTWSITPNRNESTVAMAHQELSNPIKKIIYSLFWFCKITPTDELCLNLVAEKKWDEAISLWSQEKNFSAKLNTAVLFWSERNDYGAIMQICSLLHDKVHREDFLSAVVSPNYSMSEEDLLHLFWDALFDFPITELTWQGINQIVKGDFIRKHLTDDDLVYIQNKTFSFLKSKLDVTITNAEIQPKDNYDKCSDAYYKVARTAPYELLCIKRYLGENDYRYKCFCNEIATKLLDIAIYINNNNTTDWGAPGTALNLANVAQKIAVDETLIERCAENIKVFSKNKQASTSEKIMEILTEQFKNLESENITFATIKSSESTISLHLECLKTENGSDSDLYKKVTDNAVNRLFNVVVQLYNKDRNVTTATAASTIIDKLLKYDANAETIARLKKNKTIINNNMMISLQKGDFGSMDPFNESKSSSTNLRKKQYTAKQNSARRLHKLFFSLAASLFVFLICYHFNVDNNWNNYWTSMPWIIYLGIAAIIILISAVITMWGMEIQEDPHNADFDWIDNFIDGLNDLANEIMKMGVTGRKTYSWPLAVPFQLLGLAFFVLSFPLRWIAKLISLIK